jgi:hypothetical protein
VPAVDQCGSAACSPILILAARMVTPIRIFAAGMVADPDLHCGNGRRSRSRLPEWLQPGRRAGWPLPGAAVDQVGRVRPRKRLCAAAGGSPAGAGAKRRGLQGSAGPGSGGPDERAALVRTDPRNQQPAGRCRMRPNPQPIAYCLSVREFHGHHGPKPAKTPRKPCSRRQLLQGLGDAKEADDQRDVSTASCGADMIEHISQRPVPIHASAWLF